jgi:hypothetical protein
MKLASLLVLLALVERGTANPQQAAGNPEPGTDRIAVEPVTCWWRTTATAVRVGEPFTVILTCSLLQAEAARVIADESRLDPSVVQLPPFEVVGGARGRDITTAGRRFVQFEYRLRTIAENVFASEAALPPLEITYRVESRVAGADSLAGRDRTYALPPLTMRVLSLVPDTADDIREAPVATFGEVQRVESRGTMFRLGAGVVLALGVVMLALAIAGAVRARRASRPAAPRTLAAAAVLAGTRRELSTVQEQVQSSGWTADLAGRALGAMRIVAAYAIGRPVTQRLTHADSPQPSSGELAVSGRTGPPAVVWSAVATAEDDELRDALARFTAARYGREAAFDARLDEALAAAIRRADLLIADRPWTERLWAR